MLGPPLSTITQWAVHSVLSLRVCAKHSSHSGTHVSHPMRISCVGKTHTYTAQNPAPQHKHMCTGTHTHTQPTHHSYSLFTFWNKGRLAKGHPGKVVCSLQDEERATGLRQKLLGYRWLWLISRSGGKPVPKSRQPSVTASFGSLCTLAFLFSPPPAEGQALLRLWMEPQRQNLGG